MFYQIIIFSGFFVVVVFNISNSSSLKIYNKKIACLKKCVLIFCHVCFFSNLLTIKPSNIGLKPGGKNETKESPPSTK